MKQREQILKLLETDSRLTSKEIATLLGLEESSVTKEIEDMEEENIICGYHTLVNWDKTDDQNVSAIIELRVNPQRGKGFDRIAEKIYQFNAIENLKGDNYDQQVGIDIARRAMEYPLRTIVANAGGEAAVVVDKVRAGQGNYGFNAANGEYVDMVAAGIIDPTKVTRSALQNAASVAGKQSSND